MDDDYRSLEEARRVFFSISSKEGFADFSIQHPQARQILILPVYPSNAIPDALSLVEPVIAHYMSQWEEFMVPDPDETDAISWYLESAYFPSRIADPSNAEALRKIGLNHLPEVIIDWLGGPHKVRALIDNASWEGIIEDWSNYVPAQDLGIELYRPPS